MDGITILNSYADTSNGQQLIACGIVFLLVSFISFFGAFIAGEDGFWFLAFGVSSIIIGLLFSTVGIYQSTAEPKRMIHEVIIDDSVSLSEFMDKYTILEIDGKIYTICEKEEND